MIQYGVTEVFVKHDYYSSLRVKLVRKDGDKLWLCQNLGDKVIDIEQITTTKQIYPLKKGFLLFELSDEYGYIYEDGDYSFYRYKYIKHKGSSRSSKSWSLEESAIRKCEANNGLRLTVWRDTKESLASTIWKDFKKLFPLSGRNYKFPQNMTTIFFPNGATIEPQGDDSTNAHGLTQDIAWLNEPYKMSKETFDQIDQRSSQIWLDMNPKMGHWSDNLDDHPRCMTIHSTFKLNPFCPIEQKVKILSYDPSNPINVANGTANDYLWSVYGLGLKAEKPNRILKWNKITRAQYDALDCGVMYAVDWGKVDPWGIIEAKFYDGALYLRELNYKSENQLRESATYDESQRMGDDAEGVGIVLWMFNKLKIPKTAYVVCDDNRPLKIAALVRAGWEYAMPASKPKGSIIDGIDILQNIPVYYTDDSPNIEYEQENYSWKVDRYGINCEEPEDTDNHCFTGDTMITTIGGQKRIDSITTDDYVLTTKGFKRVFATHNNGVKTINRYLMQFDTFSLSLDSTENHKIKCGENWIKMSELKAGETVYLCNNSMEKNTTYTQMRDISQKEVLGCIFKYGNILMGKLKKAFTFITRIKTRGTTGLKTLNLFTENHIYQNTPKNDLKTILNGQKHSMKEELKARNNGMVQKKENNGIENKLSQQDSEIELMENINAMYAQLNSQEKTPHKDFVVTIVNQNGEEVQELTISKLNALNVAESSQRINIAKQKLVRVDVVESRQENVYDLTICDQSEYFANGVLVHNCIDPARYTSLFLQSKGWLKIV